MGEISLLDGKCESGQVYQIVKPRSTVFVYVKDEHIVQVKFPFQYEEFLIGMDSNTININDSNNGLIGIWTNMSSHDHGCHFTMAYSIVIHDWGTVDRRRDVFSTEKAINLPKGVFGHGCVFRFSGVGV